MQAQIMAVERGIRTFRADLGDGAATPLGTIDHVPASATSLRNKPSPGGEVTPVEQRDDLLLAVGARFYSVPLTKYLAGIFT